MGREAEEEQPVRRRRRVFAAEERSFRMDRVSPAAAALRAAVADVLPRFLGSYSDDTLAEYIVVLVCNGKHQYQARDDLEAFLGDDSAKFVAWLWDHLSKWALSLSDNSSVQHGAANGSRNLNDKKNLQAVEVQPGDARVPKTSFKSRCPNSPEFYVNPPLNSFTVGQVNSKISVPQAHHGLQKLDSAKGQKVAQRRISSTVIVSPERLVGDSFWEGQHQKDHNAIVNRSFSMRKSGVAARTAQALTQEKLQHGEHLGRNASTRRFPVALGTDDDEVPEPMKRRGNVWDRLGKPAIEDRGLVRETDYMPVQNGVHKKAKLMVAGHEQRCCVNSNTEWELFDKAHSRIFSNSYSDANTVQAHGHAEKSNRSRLIGRINFGTSCGSDGDLECNHIQGGDAISQKSSLTLPVKRVQSQSLNELTSEVKSSPTAVSEPACHMIKSSKEGYVSASNKLPQLTMPRNSSTEVLHGQQVSGTAQSKTGSSVREDRGNCINNPVKDEMLGVKLKLKQMELDVLKLRSKQAQINNGKQGALSSGPHAKLEDDTDSRTVLVTNVHFAATKKALSLHFIKCGTVLKVNMLTDAITGHPKGAAYVTFAEKESIEKAVSLNGTFFFSRVLTVTRKADAPPGFLASVHLTGKPLQAWNSPLFQKGASQKQPSSYHLQWKRDQCAGETPSQLPY